MITSIDILTSILFSVGFVSVSFFGLRMMSLGLTDLRWRAKNGRPDQEARPVHRKLEAADLDLETATITVQLPIYNERWVAGRAIDALAQLEWPAERLQIQILDDSDDDTQNIVDAHVARWQESGLDMETIRRSDRAGYKAGALAHAMPSVTGEFIAIFDADFLPGPETLKQLLPCFEPGIAAVQARWAHLNADDSALTRAQAMALDGHFMIEQSTHSRLGLFMNFNGTAGIWRREAIEAAGGWQADTLTEDFDLSYRAQLAGWRLRMCPEITVPAELPAEIRAFQRQQKRWAKGSIQVLLKLGRSLFLAPTPWYRRALAIATLSAYLVQPIMLLLLLAAPLLLNPERQLPAFLGLLIVAPLGPPLLYTATRSALGPEDRAWSLWRDYPYLALLTIGLSWRCSLAVLEALTGRPSAFLRTPKRGFAVDSGAGGEISASSSASATTTSNTSTASASSIAVNSDGPLSLDSHGPIAKKSYRLPIDIHVWVEAGLALYASAGMILAMRYGPSWLAGFLGLFVLGFGLMVMLALQDARAASQDMHLADQLLEREGVES